MSQLNTEKLGHLGVEDLQQLLESLDNPTYIILELLEVEYGKQRMEVKLMKIFQMVSLVEVLVQLQLLVMIQM